MILDISRKVKTKKFSKLKEYRRALQVCNTANANTVYIENIKFDLMI